eukprot:1161814-Pelagomonas_calceolata.AAC.4
MVTAYTHSGCKMELGSISGLAFAHAITGPPCKRIAPAPYLDISGPVLTALRSIAPGLLIP